MDGRVSEAPDGGSGRQHAVDTMISLGDLKIDLATRTAAIGQCEIALPAAEFDLLWFLAQRAGRVVSRDELYTGLMRTEYDGLDRCIDLRISRLRRRLGDTDRPARIIKSIRYDGYLLARPAPNGLVVPAHNNCLSRSNVNLGRLSRKNARPSASPREAVRRSVPGA